MYMETFTNMSERAKPNCKKILFKVAYKTSTSVVNKSDERIKHGHLTVIY
jgi:hypothetical protein